MERRILLDDLIDQTSSCMRDKLKLSLRTVYGQSYGYMKVIQDYCLAHGEKYYNPILLNEFQQELESRYERGEIKQDHYLGKRKCLERLTEYYDTGTLSWTMHKLKQKYRLFDEDKALLEEFMQTLNRDANTKYDYSWVIRRYLNYLRSIGITDVRTIKTSDLSGFILSCSKEVTRGSLRNILSYTKRFHEFLRDTGRLDIPFEGLFAVSVIREEKIQQPLTTEELNRILAQIDLSTVKGKRNLAIILLGSELGLRASDIINLKLTDIDWARKELHIQQQKTSYPVGLPLTEKTAAALRDYILNGRGQTDCAFLFLKLRPPYEKIGDAVALGCMFRSYQKAAGIEHSAFDGKGFHSLRSRLGRELVIDGVPLATISQVLGYRDTEAAKQYISLDSVHLQECALDFSLIGGRRHD